MSDIAIQVEHLGKQYRLGGKQAGYSTFRETLVHATNAPVRWLKGERKPEQNDFWALDDVSFEVKHGEALGIIGRNGAGKSTLLKILSRITSPTRGRVDIYGRVGSLLEVGTGFHPELSGRENIFLNGAILGMSRVEIARKFDEIVDFSGVEKFLDTPVKHYSSGMYVRLAFAVAAHLEPEILVVDEVLAVGDAEFQKKCLGKMDDVAHQGRTVLFVSHNMGAISSLTTRTIVFTAGKLTFFGQTEEAIKNYLRSSSNNSNDLDYFRQLNSSNKVVFKRIFVNDKTIPQTLWFDQPIIFEFQLFSEIFIQNACVTVFIRDRLNQIISSICSYDNNVQIPIKPGNNSIFLKIPSAGLVPGAYSFDVAINPNFFDRWFDCLRSVTLGDVVISEDFAAQSLISPDRTWGAIHYFNASWSFDHESR